MLHFSFLGFPVRVHWMFWVMSALLSGALGLQGRELFIVLLTWVPVVFVSILWHEIGHAQARRKYGQHSEILLYGMGGLCSGPGHFTRHQSMWISAAGPAASLCLYGLTLGVALVMGLQVNFGTFGATVLDVTESGGALRPSTTMRVFNSLLWVNGFWALINLLPVYPLDGGQIFAAFMAKRNPGVVPKVGMVVAGGIAIFGLVFLGSFFMAILFGYLAYTNWQRSQGKHQGGFW